METAGTGCSIQVSGLISRVLWKLKLFVADVKRNSLEVV